MVLLTMSFCLVPFSPISADVSEINPLRPEASKVPIGLLMSSTLRLAPTYTQRSLLAAHLSLYAIKDHTSNTRHRYPNSWSLREQA
ncbi:hypothetical protein BDV96DRAFT_241374 [Lophiotrema nucula]|uniref:Secreted protein n=1 Tax=Lophiotrema nucula TaxID=690887 RepID=A0A6A5YT05_9PLEO|nr:hypothetical protein BDV96DRAFT_241374 [Lophiotrema nucula]